MCWISLAVREGRDQKHGREDSQETNADFTQDQTQVLMRDGTAWGRECGSDNDTNDHGQQEEASMIDQGSFKATSLLAHLGTELWKDRVVELSQQEQDKDDTDREKDQVGNIVRYPVVVDSLVECVDICSETIANNYS